MTFILVFSITYNLGKRQMFNQQLNDMENRYTYFVPRDHAWLKFQIKHPSAFKALFREEIGYFVSFDTNFLYVNINIVGFYFQHHLQLTDEANFGATCYPSGTPLHSI